MTPTWMIRAGSRGVNMDLFESGFVAIGFDVPKDLSQAKSLDDIKGAYKACNPDATKYEVGGAAGMLDKFVRVIKEGDHVISYDPSKRVYLVGSIAGPYVYAPDDATTVPHRRKVKWEAQRVSRDDLTTATKYSLGTLLTITQLTEEIWSDFQSVLKGEKPAAATAPDVTEMPVAEIEQDKRSLQEQAHERLKDRIVLLSDSDMQELLAAVLRGMGFRTTVSPTGPDRGVDVLASPDGLGLQEPRIKCEVKHRKKTQMGAPEIRSFIGGLRSGDKGLYLSTGGFSKEARYEAERSSIAMKLLDLDDLALLIETHYANFDAEGRALLPLTRIYWPAD
jgi:restriction system protein